MFANSPTLISLFFFFNDPPPPEFSPLPLPAPLPSPPAAHAFRRLCNGFVRRPRGARPPEARDPDTRAAQAGGERHARRSGAAAPSPAGRLRRPGRHPARGAPPREGEETQEGQEVARGPGGRRAEHLPTPPAHQGS